MPCCSRKTLFILLAIGGLLTILIALGKVSANVIFAYLPFLVCPLMCGVMLLFGCKNKTCDDTKKKSAERS